MPAMAVITVLCAAGVAFCVRFMVALCKECQPRQTVYGVHLRLISDPDPIAELQPKKLVTRAERGRVENDRFLIKASRHNV